MCAPARERLARAKATKKRGSLARGRPAIALKTLRIFISSPGDVAEERLIARRVIGRLDSQVGDVLHLQPVFWENQPLLATASFQEQLPNPSATDVVISILWSRLGTVLPGHIRRADGSSYASGTEFEFEDAVEAFRRTGKPDIVVYRKTATPEWSADPDTAAEQLKQQQLLQGFVAKWFMNPADGSLKAAFHSFASSADFEELLEAHLTRLVARHLPPGVRARTVSPTWHSGSPFRGLEVFDLEHAPVFFGRTAAVASVLLKLRRQIERGRAFVLIVSMSGGGKSSLVRAGVLPLLLQPGVVGNATQWRHVIMRPAEGQGDLTVALTQGLLQPAALPNLESGDFSTLTQRVLAALPEDCHLALVVDQLEEMFSDEHIGPRKRAQFIDALAALARSGRVCVLATLRSDVYPRLAELPTLIELKEGDGQFDLLPPARREIGQIIRSPASAAGLRFEVREHTGERLDETIRDAAAQNPGALPLLEFLLEELYKLRSSEDVLTFSAYEGLGRVEGALAQRAEQIVASVSPEAQAALPSVFGELVALGADDQTRVLRRHAPRGAFATPAAKELVDALIAARLLISSAEGQGEPVISLAHEALLEFWPRLAEWRDKNRENLHIHARLTAAVATWEQHGRSPDFLLARGKPIAEARALVADGVRLSEAESALVSASARRARRFQRIRAGAIASLVILTLLASAAAYLAHEQSNVARIQATTAQRTTDFMVNLFTVADPEENRGETVTVREILDRGVTEMRSSLSGEDDVRSNLLRAMGRAYNGLGLYPKAQPLLREALAAAERSGVADDVIAAQLALAANRTFEGEYKESEALYRSALTSAQRLHGELQPAVTAAMTGLANSLYALENAKDAEPLYRRALDLDLQMHGEDHADTARSLDALGWFLYFEGRYTEVEPLFQRALAIRQKLFGERHALTSESLNNFASLLSQEGKYDEAAEVYAKTLVADRAVYGDKHPNVASTLNNLGRVELLRDDLPSAEKHFQEARDIDRGSGAPNREGFVVWLNSLAMISLERRDYRTAEDHLGEALEIARSKRHWMLDQVLANYADLYVRTGRLAEAQTALAEARQLLEAQYGEALQSRDTWRVSVLDSIAGSYHAEQRDFDVAEKLLLGALPTLTKRFGARGLYTRQTDVRLQRLYSKWGREADARRYGAIAAGTQKR
jgi:Tfp pilus assembly protein PilF